MVFRPQTSQFTLPPTHNIVIRLLQHTWLLTFFTTSTVFLLSLQLSLLPPQAFTHPHTSHSHTSNMCTMHIDHYTSPPRTTNNNHNYDARLTSLLTSMIIRYIMGWLSVPSTFVYAYFTKVVSSITGSTLIVLLVTIHVNTSQLASPKYLS